MSTPLIGPTEYPSIRAAIDFNLDSDSLPDSIIALPIYIGEGIASVLARVPTAEAMTGADQERVQRAAIYFTAAYLAPTIRDVVSERENDITLQYSKRDMLALAESLLARANAALDPLVDSNPIYPIMFTTVSGRRGQ